MDTILICEDDLYLANIVEKAISQKLNLRSSKTHTYEDAKKLNEDFSIILLDINLPDGNGKELVTHFKKTLPNSKIIMMSAEKSSAQIIECMKLGAHNYIPKPFKLAEITSAVEECLSKDSQLSSHSSTKFEIKSKSEKVLYAYSVIDKVKDKNINIHIQGESGTGKEIFTKALALKSNKKVVSVNCPAIPSNLAESELFGHIKGSFTGADSDRTGKFEEANGGILFLDEIADLSLEIQSKILRVLQEREIEKLGSNKKIPLDVQLVSASSKNLKKEIDEGNFRLDLFYRLADIEVELPSLKDRTEDIEYLCSEFLKEFSLEFSEPTKTLTQKALNILKKYTWPGNIRELRSIIRRVAILSDGQVIDEDNIPEHLTQNKTKEARPEVSSRSLAGKEKDLIIEVLSKNNQNMSASAKELGIGRTTLYRKLKKYGINSDEN